MKRRPTTARQVRRLIAQAGFDQVQAAHAVGVSPRTMRRYVSLDPAVFREPPVPVVLALRAVVRERAADEATAARNTTDRENAGE